MPAVRATARATRSNQGGRGRGRGSSPGEVARGVARVTRAAVGFCSCMIGPNAYLECAAARVRRPGPL